ncbi:MAG: N-acetylmuramoyl-L-alanine amidase [Thermoleophilaceae bacterium]|nr:N-acetylmuramoyl-L-alanine amidase [Thermoleophilaceae bacterium]
MPSLLAALVLLFSLAAASSAPVDSNPLAALKGKTVLVDPGHNGGNAAHPEIIDKLVPAGGFRKECDTTGTATNDERLTEPAFNWDVARRLTKLLRAAGAKVVLTRGNNSGVGPCINKRAAIGNKAGADVAISIHADGGDPGGRGFHVIRPGLVRGYTGPIVKPSYALAKDVRASLDAAGLVRANYIARNGMIARKDLGGLNLSKVPKVLTELGNMRNAGDARHLKSAKWREHVARALRSGLAKYLADAQ